jgi:hypothetical protein
MTAAAGSARLNFASDDRMAVNPMNHRGFEPSFLKVDSSRTLPSPGHKFNYIIDAIIEN